MRTIVMSVTMTESTPTRVKVSNDCERERERDPACHVEISKYSFTSAICRCEMETGNAARSAVSSTSRGWAA